MARIRTIKPTHWSDKELPNISLQAHLIWIATWNFSDDDGVFEDDPLLLKSQIFPRRTDIRVEQIKQWLDQLVKARFIIPFHYKGEGYYVSRTFNTHQRIDKPQSGKVPPDELFKILQERSENIPRIVPPVEESRVKEGKGEGADGGAPNPHPVELRNEFKKVQDWINEKAPRVAKMKEPLTIDQYLKMKEKTTKDIIVKLLQKMHNWGILSKRQSAYLTFLSFLEKENEHKAA